MVQHATLKVPTLIKSVVANTFFKPDFGAYKRLIALANHVVVGERKTHPTKVGEYKVRTVLFLIINY